MSSDTLTQATLYDALVLVGETLSLQTCFFSGRTFTFSLSEAASIRITPDSAERLRVQACAASTGLDTKWVTLADRHRLTLVVREMADEALALA